MIPHIREPRRLISLQTAMSWDYQEPGVEIPSLDVNWDIDKSPTDVECAPNDPEKISSTKSTVSTSFASIFSTLAIRLRLTLPFCSLRDFSPSANDTSAP